jgi:hypothetical protein
MVLLRARFSSIYPRYLEFAVGEAIFAGAWKEYAFV